MPVEIDLLFVQLLVIPFPINQADVALAADDKGQCDTDASGCSKWGEASSRDAPLGDHASDPSNDGRGVDDDGSGDGTEKHDPRSGLGRLNIDGDGDGADHPSETSCNLGGPC